MGELGFTGEVLLCGDQVLNAGMLKDHCPSGSIELTATRCTQINGEFALYHDDDEGSTGGVSWHAQFSADTVVLTHDEGNGENTLECQYELIEGRSKHEVELTFALLNSPVFWRFGLLLEECPKSFSGTLSMDPLNPVHRRLVIPLLDFDVTDLHSAQIARQQMQQDRVQAFQDEQAAIQAQQERVREAAIQVRKDDQAWKEHGTVINFDEYDAYKQQSSKWHGKHRSKAKLHSDHRETRDARANADYHHQGRHKGPSNRHQPRGGRHKQGEKQDECSPAEQAEFGRQLLSLVLS